MTHHYHARYWFLVKIPLPETRVTKITSLNVPSVSMTYHLKRGNRKNFALFCERVATRVPRVSRHIIQERNFLWQHKRKSTLPAAMEPNPVAPKHLKVKQSRA